MDAVAANLTPAADAKLTGRRLAERGEARLRDLGARGEPWIWCLGGALALGIVMVLGLLILVLWNGVTTFWPNRIEVITLTDGTVVAGEPIRTQMFTPGPDVLRELSDLARSKVAANGGSAQRTLYRVGNYDLYGDDFRWISDFDVRSRTTPADMAHVERLEWGIFIGRISAVILGGQRYPVTSIADPQLARAHETARATWRDLRAIERDEIGAVNYHLESERLRLRRIVMNDPGPDALVQARARLETEEARLRAQYDVLAERAQILRGKLNNSLVTLADVNGRVIKLPLSSIVRYYAANELTWLGRLGVYFSRWVEFLTDEPREANTEGGVLPAIFGTFAMTLLLVVAVAPFGVVTALYLREYARQGRIIAVVRISVNNLAGVPSIVYGVFGLGFFAYIIGGSIDQVFFPERLPNPTFGTGGLLWASLTLALLTVPVVIVATEEALAAVPRSVREGSLACGASKWQTIRRVVLPQALPGIMTGLILAMARGAGEVAPLMLVGVVKLAPELPIDGFFPFVHLERSFMHLGFHIYDVGFQSRNSEAGKPMVFVTTMLLIVLIFAMNIGAILIRSRLRRSYQGGQF